MRFRATLVFGHLARELIHDHLHGAVEVFRTGRRFELTSPLLDMHFDDALMLFHRKHKLNVHGVQFEFRDFFASFARIFHKSFR